ncbi:MAG: hypothetical protein MZV70_39935 [Desulfobacterales bacterium]|nr:hypothetical protein [Desulfobacterales bacterium]
MSEIVELVYASRAAFAPVGGGGVELGGGADPGAVAAQQPARQRRRGAVLQRRLFLPVPGGGDRRCRGRVPAHRHGPAPHRPAGAVAADGDRAALPELVDEVPGGRGRRAPAAAGERHPGLRPVRLRRDRDAPAGDVPAPGRRPDRGRRAAPGRARDPRRRALRARPRRRGAGRRDRGAGGGVGGAVSQLRLRRTARRSSG